jgi:hypothetical protein
MRKSAVLVAVVSAVVAAPIAVYASHHFTDVPPSHTFHESIAWLADNGITVGCNPPAGDEFCPNDFVTRGQMSAFMKRLAEFQVVDAGTLEGQSGAAYGNPVASALAGDVQLPLTGTLKLAELEIEAPKTGALIIDGVITPTTDGGVTIGRFWIQVDDSECSTSNILSVMHGVIKTGFDDRGGSASITGVAKVSAGTRTVTMCEAPHSAGPGLPMVDVSLVAEFATSGTITGSLD